MNADKIIQDHARKSRQVKELKKTVKRLSVDKVSLSYLKEQLALEKTRKVNSRDFQNMGYFDDEGYGRAEARREARIQLLEELIFNSERN
ncbi:hypothetical protein [Rossellomorea marisflavi]|uniref:hypothetical protein n=1 Tax=Rossellomorea marisflavi TaxID=189381 RepID=UPI003FA0B98C